MEVLDVFGGELTCCRLGHKKGDPCDREELMLPMLGLFMELYRNRDGASREAYALIEPLLDEIYPRQFEYAHDGSEESEHLPLFGDLVDAAKDFVDRERDPSLPVDPSHMPGTFARRRTRRKGGSSPKHGKGGHSFFRKMSSGSSHGPRHGRSGSRDSGGPRHGMRFLGASLSRSSAGSAHLGRRSPSLGAESTDDSTGRPGVRRGLSWTATPPSVAAPQRELPAGGGDLVPPP